MLSTAIFVYAATSPVNGYFGGSLYARQGGNAIDLILYAPSLITHIYCCNEQLYGYNVVFVE